MDVGHRTRIQPAATAGRASLAVAWGSGPCYGKHMERSDRITILLSVAALCATIVGTSCSTNARISDLSANVNARFDDLNARLGGANSILNARIDDSNARLDDAITGLNARLDSAVGGLNARMDELHQDIRELRALVIEALKTAD